MPNMVSINKHYYLVYQYMQELRRRAVRCFAFPSRSLNFTEQYRNKIVVPKSNRDMSARIQVRVDSGLLEGHVCKNEDDSDKEYYSFQGIPYAKPPIGELRFKAPQRLEPWEGVKDVTEDGEQCFSRHVLYKQQKTGSEDCLTLNVYTPKIPKKNGDHINEIPIPVMIFIHGGAFVAGSNAKIVYGPEFLIRENVILVVINYRLGFLGFFRLNDPALEVPGNAGLRDMIMALKWVQNNIKSFSGDPNNVTIFGESAGAAAVHLLMLSPLAKGLFHKAIAQSGCALSPWARTFNVAPVLAEKLGIDRNDERKLLQTLREMSLEELHATQEILPDDWDISHMRPVGFNLENPYQKIEPVITEEPSKLIEEGRYNHVPFLMGYNSAEGMLIHVFNRTKINKQIPDIEQNVPFSLGLQRGSPLSKQIAQKIMKFYFGDEDPKEPDIDIHYKLLSDNFFIRDIYKTASMHSRSSKMPFYFYEMTLETSINLLKKLSGIKSPGACHGDDLSYLFRNPTHEEIQKNSPEDIGIRRFCRLWANFAKYGNPNSPEDDPLFTETWKPYTPEERCYLEIDAEVSCKRNPVHERMSFWDEIYASKHTSHKL